MNASQILNDNIELYVKGKLDGAELRAFEKQLSGNKTLASEVELQKNIQNVIKTQRILSLKHRLNKIPVSAGSQLLNGSKFSVLKVAALLVACAGLGTYFYIQSRNLDEKELAKPLITQSDLSETNPENILFGAKENITVNDDVVAKNSVVAENIDINARKKVETKPRIEPKIKTSKKTNTVKSAKKVPNMESFVDESHANVTSDNIENIKKEKVNASQLVTASDVDIQNIKDGAHSFHYKFQNKILFLYGNFEISPYEILEFNDKISQIMYLYYDKSFFEMNSKTEKIIKLKKITDKNIIAKLDIARIR